jgi:hypothetical protein
MAQTEAATVRKHILVDAPIEHAFTVFTGRFGDFKPPEHNPLGVPIAETVFEGRVGGSIVDRAVDGSECRWARILAFDPPDRAWHDRAVYHFLTTDQHRQQYLHTLDTATAPGAIAVFGCFAPDGPQHCSGLPVARYSPAQLARQLGTKWLLTSQVREEHITPAPAVLRNPNVSRLARPRYADHERRHGAIGRLRNPPCRIWRAGKLRLPVGGDVYTTRSEL